jgi:hypothetical protein
MAYFCQHLHQLLTKPLSTPNFTQPNLDVENLQNYGDIVAHILAEAEAETNLSTLN